MKKLFLTLMMLIAFSVSAKAQEDYPIATIVVEATNPLGDKTTVEGKITALDGETTTIHRKDFSSGYKFISNIDNALEMTFASKTELVVEVRLKMRNFNRLLKRMIGTTVTFTTHYEDVTEVKETMKTDITQRTEDQLYPLSQLTGKTREQLIEYAVTRFATEYFSSERPHSLIPNLSLLKTDVQPLQ